MAIEAWNRRPDQNWTLTTNKDKCTGCFGAANNDCDQCRKIMSTDDMIKYIADHYGTANQTMIAVEEMSELTKCICKCKRYPAMDKRVEPYIENIIEEIADVWIMIEQLKYLFGSAEVDKLIRSKLERQLKIIDAEME